MLKQGIKIRDSCLKQGQGFGGLGAPPYPRFCQVQPPPGGGQETRPCYYQQADMGRFPFDQKFRFEIPGIPCGEWNSIFRLVAPNGHLQASHENTKETKANKWPYYY